MRKGMTLDMIQRLEDMNTFFVVGHRGYKAAYPENTLLSFRKAIELGIDVIEFDLRLSKDGVLMVIHDVRVDRTTNGSGNVSDLTHAELKQLDAGGWFDKVFEGLKVPTFEELCEMLAAYPDILLNVEIKPDARAIEATDAAIAMLKKYGYQQRCVLTSFDAKVVAHVHDTSQLKAQGFPGEKMLNFVPGEDGTYSKMWGIGIALDQLTSEGVQKFRNMGLYIGSYCPDKEEQVRYVISCGINRVTVNNPLPALEVRQQIRSQGSAGSLLT
jgi:glycerophosphoryl diester phosphodiesterase